MVRARKLIGLLGGGLLCLVICLLPLNGLGREGKICLGLTLMTVVWWAAQVAQSGYISGIYLALLCLLDVAEPAVVFSSWTGSTVWLVIGAYLISAAVQNSGLGERLSYTFILRFVRGWRSIIASVFLLTLLLSILIPHPWPRALLIMSVMSVVIRSASIQPREASIITFTVFAASVPVSLIFITGDATINPLVASYAEVSVSFTQWLKIIGIPAVLLSVFTFILILILFKPAAPVSIRLDRVRAAKAEMGKMTPTERQTAALTLVTVGLWVTNGITKLDIGWISLIAAMAMGLPFIGGILRDMDWGEVPVHVMVFLTAAMAIGKVGESTGMNAWIAELIVPKNLPGSPILLALCISLLSVAVHMLMGSVIAVMGIAIPTFLTLAHGTELSPLLISGIVYLSVAGHYLLPFHHLNMLVGQGGGATTFGHRETMRMSGPLLVAVLFTVAASVLWWKFLGLI